MARRWTHLAMTGAAAAAVSGWLVVIAPAAAAEPGDGDTAAATSSTAEASAKPKAAERRGRESADSDEAGAGTGSAEPRRAGRDERDGDDPDRDARKPRSEKQIDDEPGVEQSVEEPALAVPEDAIAPEPGPDPEPTVIPDPGDESGPAESEDAIGPEGNTGPEDNTVPEAATVSVARAEAADNPPARRPTLLNVVGGIVVDLLVGLIHVIDGPPVLLPNSTVTVRTSTLTLPIGGGRSVQADWYFPAEIDDDTRFVYLQHGFLASGPMYSHTAARLAERTNAIVMAPSLTSNFFSPDAAWVGGTTMHRAVAELFTGDRAVLNESASTAAGYVITLPERFAFVGHSAGGTMVTSVAGYLVGTDAFDDLVGVVMLDGVEPAGSPVVGAALNTLRDGNDAPIYLISSERYAWSRDGDMADKLRLARPDRFTGVGLRGGLHIDYMEGGNPLVQFAEYVVAGFSHKRNIEAAADITIGWVNDLFDGTTDGVYGAPGEAVEVPTPSGIATAVVLPLGEPARPVWPVLLDAVVSALLDFIGRYLAVYEPLEAVSVGYRLQPTG